MDHIYVWIAEEGRYELCSMTADTRQEYGGLSLDEIQEIRKLRKDLKKQKKGERDQNFAILEALETDLQDRAAGKPVNETISKYRKMLDIRKNRRDEKYENRRQNAAEITNVDLPDTDSQPDAVLPPLPVLPSTKKQTPLQENTYDDLIDQQLDQAMKDQDNDQ